MSQLPFNRPPRSTPMVSISALKISTRLLTAVLIFFMAGLLYPGPRARRSLGAYRIPLVLRTSHGFLRQISDEPLDAFHPSAGGHDAADGGHSARRDHRVPGAAGRGAASDRLSNDRGAGKLAWREPGNHGLFGCHAARAPIRTHRGHYGDEFVELSGQHLHRLAVRPEPQYRWRRQGCAGGHQRRAQLFAGEPSEQSHVSEGESGRFTDFCDCSHVQNLRSRAPL